MKIHSWIIHSSTVCIHAIIYPVLQILCNYVYDVILFLAARAYRFFEIIKDYKNLSPRTVFDISIINIYNNENKRDEK